MNYTKQFNQEFDRIYKLLEKSLPQQFSWGHDYENGTESRIDFSLLDDEWEDYDIFEKINILAPIFTAKNEKGEWVLEEGSKENPELYFKRFDNYGEFLEAFKNNTPIEARYSELKNKAIPKTLRDLFLANCIPSNDPEQDKIKIENLKLIKW